MTTVPELLPGVSLGWAAAHGGRLICWYPASSGWEAVIAGWVSSLSGRG
ncbi:MAG: hypothetical protein ACRDVM_03735 [Acidimicrobiia bacterium]